MYNICRICSAWIIQHPSLKDWLKCNGCGFSKVEKEIITLEKFLMGRDKQYPSEYSEEIKNNATILLEKVNALLLDLGIKEAEVSSGWRPAVVNAGIANAAKKSLHMLGKAIDIVDDKNQTLCKAILTKPELLKKYNIWMEDPASTIGKNTNWCHIDIGTRSDRPLRIFKP